MDKTQALAALLPLFAKYAEAEARQCDAEDASGKAPGARKAATTRAFQRLERARAAYGANAPTVAELADAYHAKG